MKSPKVTIVDYGIGNLLSIQRGLEHCEARVLITNDPKKILSSERLILPGVGAFSKAILALENLGLIDVLREFAIQKKPLLGLCLGMQLLLDESEEFGITSGLGLIPGRVSPIPNKTLSGTRLKIPHIGWTELKPSYASVDWKESLLQDNLPDEAVYFVHSFMGVLSNKEDEIAYCNYGGHKISAVIGRNHIIGCQFHPEKSGEIGLKILRRFLLMEKN